MNDDIANRCLTIGAILGLVCGARLLLHIINADTFVIAVVSLCLYTVWIANIVGTVVSRWLRVRR